MERTQIVRGCRDAVCTLRHELPDDGGGGAVDGTSALFPAGHRLGTHSQQFGGLFPLQPGYIAHELHASASVTPASASRAATSASNSPTTRVVDVAGPALYADAGGHGGRKSMAGCVALTFGHTGLQPRRSTLRTPFQHLRHPANTVRRIWAVQWPGGVEWRVLFFEACLRTCIATRFFRPDRRTLARARRPTR